MMKGYFTGMTDAGIIRSVNQDNYYCDPEGRFFIVADGMGGHAGGQEASAIATEEIKGYLETYWDNEINSPELLEKAITKANDSILQDQQDHPERGDMGTTIVVVMIRQEEPWRAHIGDSRLYRLRDSNLEQITDDHTWVGKALKSGDLSPEQAKIHPWRHVLSQCLGRKDLFQIEIDSLEIKPGDLFLLCSDGLTEEVPDPIIASILKSNTNYENAAQALIAEAKEAGGSDNITVVLLAID
jgi:protein phosphatase